MGAMTDLTSLQRAMDVSQADEVHNLAAQSFVGTSWEQPIATAEIDAWGDKPAGGHPAGSEPGRSGPGLHQ